jgi:hypothetical protein
LRELLQAVRDFAGLLGRHLWWCGATALECPLQLFEDLFGVGVDECTQALKGSGLRHAASPRSTFSISARKRANWRSTIRELGRLDLALHAVERPALNPEHPTGDNQ